MQTARRDYGRNAVAGSPPLPPPPTPLRVVKNVSESAYAATARRAVVEATRQGSVDPKALEAAVVAILKKHGVLPVEGEREDLETFLELQRPSRLWRASRALLVIALVVGAAGFAAHWKYPAQTATAISYARDAVAKIPAPRSLTRTPSAARDLRAPTPLPVEPGPATAPIVAAPTAAPVLPSMPSAPIETQPLFATPSAGADAKAIPPPPSVAETKPATMDVAALPKADPKPTAHVSHRARSAPAAVSQAAAPAPPPAAPAEAPAIPAPHSLDDAIRRAGGTLPAVSKLDRGGADRTAAPEAKPSAEALPDHPPASLVRSALLGALPEARACLSAGEETKAIVVFESSGAVTSVQVTGPSAACIQKAFAHARVPAFAQPTYRAGVPIRAN